MLPLVAIAMLAVVQVALVAWDQMRVANAAREGARALATTNEEAAATEAVLRSGPLEQDRTEVEIAPDGRLVGTSARTTVRYRPRIIVPLIGRYVPEVTLTATVWMRIEREAP